MSNPAPEILEIELGSLTEIGSLNDVQVVLMRKAANAELESFNHVFIRTTSSANVIVEALSFIVDLTYQNRPFVDSKMQDLIGRLVH